MGLYSSWCVDRFVFAARECFAFSRHDNMAALVVERILAWLCVDKLRSIIPCLFDLRYNIVRSKPWAWLRQGSRCRLYLSSLGVRLIESVYRLL
jgi:hypothetical protein